MSTPFTPFAVFANVLFLVACGGTSSQGGRIANAGQSAALVLPSSLVLSADEARDLRFMREEEKLARDVYLTLATYWRGQAGAEILVTTLDAIAPSEQRHMDRLKAFLGPAGLTDPVVEGEILGMFTDPILAQLYTDLVARGKVGVVAALKVGALIEEKDIFDLVDALSRCQTESLRTAYGGLNCGSENHLRSFATALQPTEGAYLAQILPQAQVDSILAAAKVPCGGN